MTMIEIGAVEALANALDNTRLSANATDLAAILRRLDEQGYRIVAKPPVVIEPYEPPPITPPGSLTATPPTVATEAPDEIPF